MAKKTRQKAKKAASSPSRGKSSGKGKSGAGDGGRKAPKKKAATGKASKAGTRKSTGKSGASKTHKPTSKKSAAKPARKAQASRRTKRGAGGKRKAGAVVPGHTHDDLYAVRLVEELEFRHGIDVATLDIGIRDGKARVRGVVSDQDELDAVRETVGEGGGISEFEYFVQIAPSRRERDREHAQEVQDVLDGEPDLQAQNIHVASLNTKIILRGVVADPIQKVKAGLIALRHGDTSKVRNRLVVMD